MSVLYLMKFNIQKILRCKTKTIQMIHSKMGLGFEYRIPKIKNSQRYFITCSLFLKIKEMKIKTTLKM